MKGNHSSEQLWVVTSHVDSRRSKNESRNRRVSQTGADSGLQAIDVTHAYSGRNLQEAQEAGTRLLSASSLRNRCLPRV